MKHESARSAQALQYLYLPPRVSSANGAKAPVLVLLHGVGSNERDLVRLAETLDPRLAIYSLRGPLQIGPDNFAWFHVTFTEQGPVHNRAEAEDSRLALKKFLEDLKQKPEVDPMHVFLLGFSQGAIMNLSLTLTEPKLVNGVIAISGRTLQEVAALAKGRTYDQSPKVLLMHGKEDGKLPFFHGEASAQVLKESHLNFEFKTYSAGHEITSAMLEDIKSWLVVQLSNGSAL